jgi:hypothetical protein
LTQLETSELSSMGLPVPELVPVPVLRCPVLVLVICAFGYLHRYLPLIPDRLYCISRIFDKRDFYT